jgi:hypothetical protein
MAHDFSGHANRVLDQEQAPHKFMARRQRRVRTVIWLASSIILAMLLLVIMLGKR